MRGKQELVRHFAVEDGPEFVQTPSPTEPDGIVPGEKYDDNLSYRKDWFLEAFGPVDEVSYAGMLIDSEYVEPNETCILVNIVFGAPVENDLQHHEEVIFPRVGEEDCRWANKGRSFGIQFEELKIGTFCLLRLGDYDFYAYIGCSLLLKLMSALISEILQERHTYAILRDLAILLSRSTIIPTKQELIFFDRMERATNLRLFRLLSASIPSLKAVHPAPVGNKMQF